MRSSQRVLDRYAAPVPAADLARPFLEYDRWSGSDPRLLVAEAAASTTGQQFTSGVKPAVTRFRETVVDGGRIESFADLAALECEDEDLVAALGARRKRHILLEIDRIAWWRETDPDEREATLRASETRI